MHTCENLKTLLTPAQFADKFQVSERFLQNDRVTKQRIPFVKIGRFVRYREADGIDYIRRHTIGGEVT